MGVISQNCLSLQMKTEELEKQNLQLREECATLNSNVSKADESVIQSAIEDILHSIFH